MDFLAARDSHRPAYAAASRFDGGPELPRLTVPTTVMARSDPRRTGAEAVLDLPRSRV